MSSPLIKQQLFLLVKRIFSNKLYSHQDLLTTYFSAGKERLVTHIK
ncbi:hypothetical protein CLV24_11736 [Pontibacter ummariensis]|uniref:Uncharacterized protein n=1 Tax=Pontibacter ummariensis TaxID=1610492 RepID=A0A239IG19_9BACT|nr:hypothetical protein CLV24_11736 [Pontibacter ummariensis]SNS92515.1 hypothetical protein SAMN06296052_11736 [Pontibacter ummariensis]